MSLPALEVRLPRSPEPDTWCHAYEVESAITGTDNVVSSFTYADHEATLGYAAADPARQ
jgi:hypothetical protein